jgi:hypothetical protein
MDDDKDDDNDVGIDEGRGLVATIEVRAYIVDILERHGAYFHDPQALSCLIMKDLVSSQIHDITAIDFKPVQNDDCSSDMVSKRLSLYLSLCLDNKGHCLDSLLQGHHHHHHHNRVNHINDGKLFHCTIPDLIALNISLSIIACPTITCCENIIALKLILPTMNAIKSNHNRLDGDDNNRNTNSNSDTLNMNSVATVTGIRRLFQHCVALQTFLLILGTIEDDKHTAKEGRRYEAVATAVATTTTTTTAHIINHESVSYWSHCSGDGHCSPSSMHMRRLIMNNSHTRNQAVSPEINRDHTHQYTIAAAVDVDESVENFVCSMFMRYVFVMIEQIIASSTNHHDHQAMLTMTMKRSGRLVFNTSMLPVRTLLSFNEHAANTTLSIEYLELVLDMVDRLAKGLGPSATTCYCSKHNSAIGHDMLTVLSVCMSFTEQILSESGHSSSSSSSITSSSQYEHFPLQILKISNEILRRFVRPDNDHRPGNNYDRLLSPHLHHPHPHHYHHHHHHHPHHHYHHHHHHHYHHHH